LSPFRFAPLQSHDQPALLRLEAIIMQMVIMDEDKRPRSMAAIKQELQRITTQQAVLQAQTANAQPVLSSAPPKVPQVSRTPRCIYRTHSTEVNTAVWSPDGTQILSISNDGIAQIWDATTGNTIFTYSGPRDHV